MLYDSYGRTVAIQKEEDEYVAPIAGLTLQHNPKLMDNDTNFAPKVALPDTAAANVVPAWNAPKHPVSRLQEYCSQCDMELSFEVDNQKGPCG